MGVEVKLSRDDIFKAVFQYIKNEYQNMVGTQASIHIEKGKLKGATVDCQYRQQIEEFRLKPRKMY